MSQPGQKEYYSTMCGHILNDNLKKRVSHFRYKYIIFALLLPFPQAIKNRHV